MIDRSTRRVRCGVCGLIKDILSIEVHVKEQTFHSENTDIEFDFVRLTVGVTGAGAGVDSAWEQYKLEARKMLLKRAESHLSGARCVRRTHRTQAYLIDNEHQTHLEQILHSIKIFAKTKKNITIENPCR